MKSYRFVLLLAISLICKLASTAQADITAFFTASNIGQNSGTNSGVYEIDAATPGARGTLLIPAGGLLSLSDPRGLAFESNSDLNTSGASNYSLLVSSAGNDLLDLYNLDGSPSHQIDPLITAPQRIVVGPPLSNPQTWPTSVYGIDGGANANGVLSAAQNIFNLDGGGVDPVLEQSLVGGQGPGFGHVFTSITVGSYQNILLGGVINGQAEILGVALDPHSNSVMSVGTFAGNLAGTPVGMTLGPFGVLYVAESSGGATGGFVEKFGQHGADLGTALTLDPTSNSAIEDLGFGPDGKLYVLEQDRLERFDVSKGAGVLQQANAFPTGTIANTLLMSPNTFPGGVLNLSFSATIAGLEKTNSMTIQIPNVQAPGVTSALGIDPTTLSSLPGVTLLSAVNLSSNALFNGSITLDFNFDPSLLPAGYTQGDLRLFTYDPVTGLQSATSFVNFDSHEVQATVDSLGTFAIGVVPEPASFILAALCGLAVLACRRRRA